MHEPIGTPVTYRCAECGGGADVVGGVITRACGHDTAAVQANISATVRGIGGMAAEQLAEQLTGAKYS